MKPVLLVLASLQTATLAFQQPVGIGVPRRSVSPAAPFPSLIKNDFAAPVLRSNSSPYDHITGRLNADYPIKGLDSRNDAQPRIATAGEERAITHTRTPKKMRQILGLARFRFLAYSPLEYSLGIAMAQYSCRGGPPSALSSLQWIHGLAVVSMIHAMCHYFNEHYDYETDRCNLDTNGWTGGSGILPRHPELLGISLKMGWIMLTVCLVLTATLRNSSASSVAFLAILISWQYSAPPLRLNGGMGVGEVIVGMVLAIFVPSFGYLIGRGGTSAAAFQMTGATIFPLFIKASSRQLMMNIPDIQADLRVNKRNICGRVGSATARKAFAFGTILPYLLVWAAAAQGFTPIIVAFLQTTTLPLALLLAEFAISKEKSDTWLAEANIPFLASFNLQLFNVMALVGFHFGQHSTPSPAFLAPLGVFAFATSRAVKQILCKVIVADRSQVEEAYLAA